MSYTEKNTSVNKTLIVLLVVASAIFIKMGYILDGHWYWGLLLTIPVLLIVVVENWRVKHPLKRH
jgi:hypothetical protein